MCGIVGYVGVKQAAPILLSGLMRLEYRGYDSAGIAVRNDSAEHIEIVKVKGRLKNLMDMTDSGRAVAGCCGIGHTRWATHGEPSVLNAHPHFSEEKRVVAVHNGIIENYQEIAETLKKKGYVVKSQTDTEVAVLLLDSYYAENAKKRDEFLRTCPGCYYTFDEQGERKLCTGDSLWRSTGCDLCSKKGQPVDHRSMHRRGKGKPDCLRCSGCAWIDQKHHLYGELRDCSSDAG